MPSLFDLKRQRAHALNKADSIVAASERENRDLTAAEALDVDTAMAAVHALTPQIQSIEKQNTIRQHLVNGKIIPAGGNLRQARTPNAPVRIMSSACLPCPSASRLVPHALISVGF